MNIAKLIKDLQAKGVKLGQKDGQLKFKAKKDAWTDEIRDLVIEHKQEIIDFFIQKSAAKKEPSIPCVSRTDEDGNPIEAFPLSFSQERLWFIDQLEPNSASYNIPFAVTIRGNSDGQRESEPVDISLIEQALNHIIDRHETLRTIFPKTNGVGQQQILPSIDFKLECVDLSHIETEQQRHTQAQELCKKEARTPFNLFTGPLLRAKAFKIDPQQYIILLNIHHIISDGWSMTVMVKEFTLIMDALSQGKQPILPPLPIQYLDYSVWQRQWLGGEQANSTEPAEQGSILHKQLSYWQQKLEGVSESLNLPTDYPRPNEQSYAGDRYVFNVDAQLTKQLTDLAQQKGATLYMVLLAAFKVLLHRYSNQQDICVGSPVANRHYAGTEGLIGMFINTLVLRSQVEGEHDFSSLLSEVKRTCLQAYEHQDTPFERIVDLVQPERNTAVSPLFQVMLILQNMPGGSSRGNIEAYPLEVGMSKFDITLEFNETPQGLRGSIEYRSELFKPQTIERLAEHFNRLCQAITSTPSAKISELEFIGAQEKHQLLISNNDNLLDYPKNKCIHQLVIEQAITSPDKIAVQCQNETLSYQQLYDRSGELALYLQHLGVKPDTLVGLCTERSLEMIIGVMAILRAGGAYVPLDPEYPDERLSYMIQDSKATIVLTGHQLKDKLSSLVAKQTKLIAIDKQAPEVSECIADLTTRQVKLAEEVTTNHLAYVIYTSGSTGQPKGVAIEHRSTAAMIAWAQGVFDRQELSGMLASTSVCFDLSVYEIFLTLSRGGKIILVPNVLALIGLANKTDVTLINTVPSAMEELIRSNALPETVQTINLAGEPLSPALVDKLYATSSVKKVYDLYGPSEDTTYSTFTLREPNGQQTIGRPINNTQVYILDEHNNPQPIGVPGELHLAGDGLARGYLYRSDLTDEKFVSNPFNSDTRMYKTGDLARWLDNGQIEYMGRIDHQVKVRGFRIELGEIESQLNHFPQIDAAVVIAQGQGEQKRLVAYYVANETTKEQLIELAGDQLKTHLLQTLPEYMLPVAFVSIEAIPLMPNGKIDRRALERKDVVLKSDQDYLAPRNATEKALVAIWAEVLNIEPQRIGINDNFFDFGGDSIKTIQIVSKAIEQNIYFDIRDMFKYQSIHDLVKNCDVSKVREIIREEGVLTGPIELSPIQSYFFDHRQTDIHYYNQAALLHLNVGLDIESLQQIVAVIVEQHDVLNARFSQDDNCHGAGGWQQRYLGAIDNTQQGLGIEYCDISKVEQQQRDEHIERTCDHWQAQLDIENGPIMRWVYFDAKGNGCDQLAIIIHHLVIDGVSWRILLEDFHHLIGQQVNQQPLQLSQKRSSYRNWVDSLASYKDSEQGQKDLAFWVEQSEKAQQVNQGFVDKGLSQTDVGSSYRKKDIGQYNVQLSKANTDKLLTKCHQAYGTEINDLLLTAVMLSHYQATGNSNLMIDLEGHGRDQMDPAIDITKTLGWFTSLYPVCFELTNPESIGQSIKDIKTALNEIPNKGVGYAVFRYINQDETVKTIPQSQVVFNFLGDFQSNEQGSDDSYFTFGENSSGKPNSEQAELNQIVTINGMVVFNQLSFTFSYPKAWSEQAIGQWQTHFISILECLIAHCEDSTRLGYTPSDFPLVNASLAQLDNAIVNLEQQQQIELDNIQDIYPLTALQSGILFETLLAQTEQNTGMYVTQAAFGIEGQGDVDAIQKAWQAVVAHYDILRMQVVPSKVSGLNTNLQVVLKQADVQIDHFDWPQMNHTELKAACEQWMQQSKRRGISLNQAPLIRINLFQGNESCYMLFEQHHIMMDGWSQGIVLANLFKVYQALVNQQDYQLPPTAPYSAYVDAFVNRDRQAETVYWQDYLSDYEEKTPLPMDHLAPRHSAVKDVFNIAAMSLSEQESLKLEQLVKTHRLTTNTVLQFIWGLLLHLHSGNQNITFGSVSSGRTGILDIKHSDQMVGLCINTTPTCVLFDPELTLVEQLKQMHYRESEKLNYETTPLVDIQELLGNNTNEDFFQTLFVYENYPVEKVAEASSIIKDFISNEAPNYPLTVVGLANEVIDIAFTYDDHFYTEQTVNTLMEQFKHLTLQLIADPQVLIKDVSLLTPAQQQQLLVDFNDTQVGYQKDKCIHQLFIEQVALNPDHIAVEYQGESLSYQQLYDQSYDLAVYLQSLGVKPDSVVALCVENSLDMMVGILGILQAGGAYLPLDSNYPDDRLSYMLADSQAAIVLTQDRQLNKLNTLVPQDTQLIVLDTQATQISDSVAELKRQQIALQHEVKANNLAYMIYTSGSTGQPKGVMVEHQSLHALCVWHKTAFNVTPTSKATQVSNIAFDASVWEIWPYLVNSASVVLVQNEIYSDINQLHGFIKDNQVTHCFLITPIAQLLLQLNDLDLPKLQYLLTGGDKLSIYEDRDYNFTVVNNYGPTESTVVATSLKIAGAYNTSSIGGPISNTQTYILNQYNNPVPVGVAGELHIAGDSLARGYFNRPEITDEVFIDNPFNPGTRIYKSGDLARWLDNGQIEYLGRIGTQVKVRGYRIELGEIEAQLNQNPQIKDCAVIAKGQGDQKQLIGFIVATQSTENQVLELDSDELKAYLGQTLPDYMVPVAFASLGVIPLTPNGKVDRRALAQIDVSMSSSQDYMAARNAKEQQLVEIWAEVLNLDSQKVGINDNFFELGGDSIKTIQIVSKAMEYQIYFDIRDMFDHQSIHELLKHCDTSKSKEIIKEQGILEGPVALSPIQSYFFNNIQTDRHHFNQAVLLNLNVQLPLETLQQLFSHLLEQHDVLRARYTQTEQGWQQEYLGAVDSNPQLVGIECYDIAELDEKQIADYVEQTCDHWQAQLDIENGPLMRWVYFNAKNSNGEGNGCDQLAIIIHHLVIDGVSWRILLEDLNVLIEQQLNQQPLQLSAKRSSYRNWVDSLSNYKNTEQGQKDLAFWIEQSEKAQGIEDAFEAKTYRNDDMAHSNVLLSKSNTEKLLKQCHQAYGTEINDLLLTAVMLSYYQATGSAQLVIDLEGHGREQIDPAIEITNTLGWFTSMYPANLALSNPQDLGQSIKDIKTALHQIPNKGIGFSIFRYIDEHESIKDFPPAQVVFNFLGGFESNEGEQASHAFSLSDNSTGRMSSKQKEVHRSVSINGMVVFDQLSFTFSYPQEWTGQNISHWQTHFITVLEALIEHCDDSPKLGYTPSDFPLLSATLPQLDKVTSDLQQIQGIELDNIEDIYPLTALQSGILFETLYAQTDDNKGMYLTQTAVCIEGQADVEVMQQAWQCVINHYDIFRMLVIPADSANINVDLQVILKQVQIKVDKVDCSDKTNEQLKSVCEQRMKESKASGIDLTQAPLMRVTLLQGQQTCYMLFEQHHIAMDGWSQSIVLGNLFKVYQALEQQQSYQLPPNAPHKAYVKAFLNRDQEQETSYWTKYLADYEQRTPLPMEHLTVAQDDSESGFSDVDLYLSKADSLKLEQLVKTHRLTMNTALQFIWGLLLHLHSGNKTVTFGSVSSGRAGLFDIKHNDQMVGLCINTTPTCIDFDSQLSLLEQLKRMQGRESEKLSYEMTPLIQIQEILGLNSNEGFFQSLFVYENYPVEKVAGTSSIIKDVVVEDAPNYPLTVTGGTGEQIHVYLTYDHRYFDQQTVANLMAQFERLIMQLINSPEMLLQDVCLISKVEKQQLIVDLNDTQVDYPQDKCIHERFIEQVKRTPNDIAVIYTNQGVDTEQSLTYQQLYDQSHDLAIYLQSLGVQADSLVGICVDRSLDMIVGVMGILQAGGAYVPLEPNHPDERLSHMLQDSQVAIVLTEQALKDKLSGLIASDTKLIALDQQSAEIQTRVNELTNNNVQLINEVTPDHMAYVIYTSGSTGKPKGVMVEHRGVTNSVSWFIDNFNITENSKLIQLTDYTFDPSVEDIFGSLATGATLHIPATELLLDEGNLVQYMREKQITGLNFVPGILRGLLCDYDRLDSIEFVISGGDKLEESVKNAILDKGYNLYNNYGPTEATIDVLSSKCTHQPVVIGQPIANTQVYVLDANHNPVPFGVAGQLFIAGDGLARGYLNSPELTEEKFIPNPFNSGTRLYKSGDRVRWVTDKQGNHAIEYMGRIDTQVKIRGYRIETGEIEAALNQHPQIKGSVVVAQGQEANKKLVAFYVVRQSEEDEVVALTNNDLKVHLQQTLPEYMMPAAFERLEQIPLTTNGKVDHRKLENTDVTIASGEAYIAPRNEIESQMVQIWAEVLKLSPETIGVNDDFFELGGHSLLATQVISKIRSQLDINVPLKSLFSATTLAGVAEIAQAIKTQHEKPSLDTNLTDDDFEEFSI